MAPLAATRRWRFRRDRSAALIGDQPRTSPPWAYSMRTRSGAVSAHRGQTRARPGTAGRACAPARVGGHLDRAVALRTGEAPGSRDNGRPDWQPGHVLQDAQRRGRRRLNGRAPECPGTALLGNLAPGHPMVALHTSEGQVSGSQSVVTCRARSPAEMPRRGPERGHGCSARLVSSGLAGE